MSWATAWLLPFPEVPREAIRAAVARSGRDATMSDNGASVALENGRHGWIRLEPEPPVALQQIVFSLDDLRRRAEAHNAKHVAALPRNAIALLEARRNVCAIAGDGRATLEVFTDGTDDVVPKTTLLAPKKDWNDARVICGQTHQIIYGRMQTLLRRGTERWRRLSLVRLPDNQFLAHDTWIANALAIHEKLLFIDRLGRLYRSDTSGGPQATRIEGLAEAVSPSDAMGRHHSLDLRGDGVWIANGSAAIYVLRDDALRLIAAPEPIRKLAAIKNGRVWAAGENILYVLDGDRLVEGHRAPQRLSSLAAMPGGVAVATAGSQLIIARGDDIQVHELTGGMTVIDSLAADEDDILWLTGSLPDGSLALARIALPSPPRVRMEISSKDDDNHDAWEEIATIATGISQDLGGFFAGEC